ncbi:Replicative DNA helicase, partial [Durusdinium trenchii]
RQTDAERAVGAQPVNEIGTNVATVYRIRNWDEAGFVKKGQNDRSRELPWVAIPTKHHGTTFTRLMRTDPTGSVYGCWICLVALAGRLPAKGTLACEEGPLSIEDMAAQCHVDPDTLKRAIDILQSESIQWIEAIPWNESLTREQTASSTLGSCSTTERNGNGTGNLPQVSRSPDQDANSTDRRGAGETSGGSPGPAASEESQEATSERASSSQRPRGSSESVFARLQDADLEDEATLRQWWEWQLRQAAPVSGDSEMEWQRVVHAASRARAETVKRPIAYFAKLVGAGTACPESPGAELIRRERIRQMEKYPSDHDDDHEPEDLIDITRDVLAEEDDLWGIMARHRSFRIEQLTIAGALIAAEIDRRIRDAVSSSDARASHLAAQGSRESRKAKEVSVRTSPNETGPVYGVPLIRELPLDTGSMRQAMPSRHDLELVRQRSQRAVAGYEILLARYCELVDACKKLLDAPHNDHFVARLNDEEMDGIDAITSAIAMYRAFGRWSAKRNGWPRLRRAESDMADPMNDSIALPNAVEAERALLGACVMDPSILDDLRSTVTADQLYSGAGQTLLSSLFAMREAGDAIDEVTIVKRLIDRAGGSTVPAEEWPLYVLRCMESCPLTGHWEHYAGLVRDAWLRRCGLEAGTAMQRALLDTTRDVEEALSQVESTLTTLVDRQHGRTETASMESLIFEVFESFDKPDRSMKTGYSDLDTISHGVRPSEMVIIAARPSVGKTAFALNLLRQFARTGTAGLLVSLEQGRLQIAERLLSLQCGHSIHDIREGKVDNLQLQSDSWELTQLPIIIDDRSGVTTDYISSVSRRMKRRHKIGVIVVDYLQLVEPTDSRAPREQQVSQMSRRLKLLATQLDVPVVVLSQLNRAVESRPAKGPNRLDNMRPKLSDLRESGAIEQDADQVWLLWRPFRDEPDDPDHPIACIDVAKNRNGPTGVCRFVYRQECYRFDPHADVSPAAEFATRDERFVRYGADGFRYGWNQSIAQIEFSAQGRLVRFTLRLPDPEADRFVMTPAGKKRRSRDQQLAAWEQECRSLWRALLLAIRAKLESTEIGLSAFEQEFFAFIVDPLTNRTVYDEVRTALEARNQSGGFNGADRMSEVRDEQVVFTRDLRKDEHVTASGRFVSHQGFGPPFFRSRMDTTTMTTEAAGKPAIESKTMWANAAAIAIWLIGLIVESAELGTLPEGWTEYAALIVAVGNMVLRSITTEPLTGLAGGRSQNGDVRLPVIALCVLLIPAAAMADARAIITGPSGGVPGDEIILDASDSVGDTFGWDCVRRGYSPNDTHFQIASDGRSLQISSYPGVYDVTLMVSDG